MAIETIEFGRPSFCLHEKYILHFASQGLPIPAEPSIAADMIAHGLIEQTEDDDVFRLTERGHEAYRFFRYDIRQAVAA